MLGRERGPYVLDLGAPALFLLFAVPEQRAARCLCLCWKGEMGQQKPGRAGPTSTSRCTATMSFILIPAAEPGARTRVRQIGKQGCRGQEDKTGVGRQKEAPDKKREGKQKKYVPCSM